MCSVCSRGLGIEYNLTNKVKVTLSCVRYPNQKTVLIWIGGMYSVRFLAICLSPSMRAGREQSPPHEIGMLLTDGVERVVLDVLIMSMTPSWLLFHVLGPSEQ